MDTRQNRGKYLAHDVDDMSRTCYSSLMALKSYSVGDLVRWFGCDPHGIVTESSLGIVVTQGSLKFATKLSEVSGLFGSEDAYASYLRDQYNVYVFDKKSLVWCHYGELELVSPAIDGAEDDEAHISSQ